MTNEERARLNLEDMSSFILGALLALLAAVLLSGCSTINDHVWAPGVYGWEALP